MRQFDAWQEPIQPMIDTMLGNEPSLHQFRLFCVVAEEMHFRSAAERLHMTQPPLTRHIQALERSYGVKLFERTSRRVKLTAAGEKLYFHASRLLANLEHMRRSVASADTRAKIVMSIGFVESVALGVLPRLLRELHVDYPQAELVLKEMHSDAQIAALQSGGIDACIVRLPVDTEGLEVQALFADRLVAVVSDQFPHEAESISIEKLAKLPAIVYSRSLGGGLYDAFIAAFVEAGCSPNIVHESTSTLSLLALVSSGEGFALVSSHLPFTPGPGLRFIDLESEVVSQVVMCWRKGEDNPLAEIATRIGPLF